MVKTAHLALTAQETVLAKATEPEKATESATVIKAMEVKTAIHALKAFTKRSRMKPSCFARNVMNLALESAPDRAQRTVKNAMTGGS